ncbi:MAG: hypothetical protein GX086_07135, partial [Alcaligenaceae bacterium]|nr:hypothetical protein [Alcaligenaceae bacterium]
MMLGISHIIFDKTVRIDVLVRLLSTGAVAKDHALLAKDAPWIAAYFFSILMLSIGLSSLVKHLVSRFRLDRANGRLSKFFRFRRAPWYYLLSGADFAKHETPDFIQIAAVVQLDGQSFIYQGILEHYYTDETGQLDRLVISNASRRSLKNDDASLLARRPHNQESAKDSTGIAKRKKNRPTARFYPIIGDYFILHYDEVVTLNVRYFKLITES